MKQVNISKNGIITNSAQFDSESALNSWLDSHKAMGTFGREAVMGKETFVIAEAVFDEDGITLLSPEVSEQVDVMLEPAEYAVEIIDMTEELAQSQVNEEALHFLKSTDYKVTKHRDQMDMGISPDLTVEEFQYLLEQRQQARDAIK